MLERQPHAGHREAADRERRRRRQDAPVEVADVQVAAVHRRAGLAHLRVEDHAHGRRLVAHRERRADVADDRPDDVALPRAVVAAPRGATAEPNRGRVDRFLSERAEALALKRRARRTALPIRRRTSFSRVSTARVSIMPRRISSRSSSLRLAAMASRTRNPSHRGHQLIDALRTPRLHAHAGRRLDRLVAGRPRHGRAERARQRRAHAVDRARIRRRRLRDAVERRQGGRSGERELLGDESEEAIAHERECYLTLVRRVRRVRRVPTGFSDHTGCAT